MKFTRYLAATMVCTLGLGGFDRATGQEKPDGDAEKASKEYAKGNNELAVDLYGRVAAAVAPEANLCFSPLSIRAAMAMVYAKANGETAREIEKVFRFDTDRDRFARDYSAYTKQIKSQREDFGGEFVLANRLWVSSRLSTTKAFRELIQSGHGADVQTADFQSQPEKVRQEINRWVEDQTRRRIRDLLPEDSIDSKTTMIAANAFFFRADWSKAFDLRQTSPQPFSVSRTTKVDVPMMHTQAQLGYLRVGGTDVVHVPYKNSPVVMRIIVPADFDQYDMLAPKGPTVEDWTRPCGYAKVSLSLPKLTLESTIPFAKHLKSLGVIQAFSENLADFSRLGPTIGKLAEVYTKSTLEIDEKGTIAASATAVRSYAKSLNLRKEVIVRCDRPFFLALIDTRNAAILFVARVSNPAKAVAPSR